jgi:tetratricopeptide (TPR) repeat protein
LARAYVNLGKAYGAIDNHLKAENLLRQAIELEPDDGHAYLSLGASLENQKRYGEAIAIYQKSAGLKGTNQATLHKNLATAYYKSTDFSKSVYHAQKSIALNPYDYSIYSTLGAAYFKTGDLRLAETTLEEGVRLFPEKGDLYVQLGTVYENQNRLPEAVAILQKAVAIKDFSLARAYNNLGIVFWRMKNYKQSVYFAKQALTNNPNLLDAYLTLGITYEDMGRQDLALAQFRNGWLKGLDMVAVYSEWADNFLKMNQLDRAILYLKEAVKLESDRPEIHKKLASAYERKGLLKEAENEKRIAEKIKRGQ